MFKLQTHIKLALSFYSVYQKYLWKNLKKKL